MKNEEINYISSKKNAAIIAPAGHGKTEMITELVDYLPGKKLVLTHTNAGVEALTKRLKKKKINGEKYRLLTISSFCMSWCGAYPYSAGINQDIGITDKNYYPMIHRGAGNIFSHRWSREIIAKTYSYIIVDEYQDCVLNQHQIFLELNKDIPIYVLGDPLQAIFGFKEKLVSWQNIGFEIVKPSTRPWRWENTNPSLGKYLMEVRKKLLPGLDGNEVYFPINPIENAVNVLRTSDFNWNILNDIINKYESIVYIAKWPNETEQFAKLTGGLFQNDETQNLNDLYKFAQLLDIDDGYTRCNVLFDFMEECAIHVSTELSSYKNHIEDGNFNFHSIKKFPEFGERMLSLYNNHSYADLMYVMRWIKNNPTFRLYRRELFIEMERSIQRAQERNISIAEAAQEIRMVPGNHKRYSNIMRLSSRTLLSKGLEFDCVIIDLSRVNKGHNSSFSSTEMYVAMTRAKKVIYFITNDSYIKLSVPQGI